MNVAFIPTRYSPTFEETKRLESWQRQLELWRAELAYQCRELDPYQKALSKARYHNSFRDNLKLIKTLDVVL